MSCVFITCFAILADETTSVGLEPSLRKIKEPYFFESSWKFTPRDELSSWCKFPMKGRPLGPGGSVGFSDVVLCFLNKKKNRKRAKERITKGDMFYAIIISLKCVYIYEILVRL